MYIPDTTSFLFGQEKNLDAWISYVCAYIVYVEILKGDFAVFSGDNRVFPRIKHRVVKLLLHYQH